jgi:hypothetical protein
VADAEQQRNAVLEAAVTQLTASVQPKSNILNAGVCNPSLIPLLFFIRDITTFCNWDPGDGTPSVRVQIEYGSEPNDVMRSMLAQYFGRGPFLGDSIGTVLKHHTHSPPPHKQTRGRIRR